MVNVNDSTDLEKYIQNIDEDNDEDDLTKKLKTALYNDVSTTTTETFLTTTTNSINNNIYNTKEENNEVKMNKNENINYQCGFCCIKLKNNQNFANIKLFVFFMCVTVMLTNALTVGYRSSVITTIEKFFELSSSMSGTLSGCLEVGSLISTLLVSYFFADKSIPKCIAASSICCSIGSFMYAIPHFITNYKIKNELNNKAAFNLLCQLNGNIIDDSKLLFNNKEPCFEKTTNLSLFILLIIANVLIGSSSAPLYTLGTTYIDNHVSAHNSSIYLGFVYSMLAFGPVVGYLLGAALLRVYVNVFNMKQFLNFDLSPTDSTWIGCWWLGFVILAFLLFFTSFPYFFFPNEMKRKRKKEMNQNVFWYKLLTK
jgi:solute carrier organic anion transporter family, member 3A